MYKLNKTEITEEKVEALIQDLAMFPMEQKDIELPMQKRIEKYKDILESEGNLQIAETLVITK